MSAQLVLTLANAASQDGLQHPQLEKLAKMGGRCKYPANMHRDLLLVCGDFAKLGGCVTKAPSRVNVLKKKGVSEQVDLNFLLHHKLLAAIFHSLHDVSISSVLGGSAGNIVRFWTEMKKHPFVGGDLSFKADLILLRLSSLLFTAMGSPTHKSAEQGEGLGGALLVQLVEPEWSHQEHQLPHVGAGEEPCQGPWHGPNLAKGMASPDLELTNFCLQDCGL